MDTIHRITHLNLAASNRFIILSRKDSFIFESSPKVLERNGPLLDSKGDDKDAVVFFLDLFLSFTGIGSWPSTSISRGSVDDDFFNLTSLESLHLCFGRRFCSGCDFGGCFCFLTFFTLFFGKFVLALVLVLSVGSVD